MGAGGLNRKSIILQRPLGSLINQRKKVLSLLHPLWPWLSHLRREGGLRPQLVWTLGHFTGAGVWGAPAGHLALTTRPGQKHEGVCGGVHRGLGRGTAGGNFCHCLLLRSPSSFLLYFEKKFAGRGGATAKKPNQFNVDHADSARCWGKELPAMGQRKHNGSRV